MNPRIVSRPLAANSLAQAAIDGTAPTGWYEALPRDANAWRRRVELVRTTSDRGWLALLEPAFQASGRARERLAAAANGAGIVVTTGQQPGLFGGPMYTLTKALSVLAVADALQDATGVACAPVFWAATDDTDFKEASSTIIAAPGGAQLLRITHAEALGQAMSSMRLGEVSQELEALAHATGSTVDPMPLELVEKFYTPEETVGSAYVSLLRELFAPLGIAVLDASHAATRAAGGAILTKALELADDIAKGVSSRNSEIVKAGYEPQVQDVPGLSLVFSVFSGSRKRIPIKAARKHTASDEMGPNVLLRPVVERGILPTAVYLGGPAEIAYFAQLGPIADAVGVTRPAIAPRWSCTVIEPHVEKILQQLQLSTDDFRDPHEVETRVARAHLPARVLSEIQETRDTLTRSLDAVNDAATREGAPITPAVVAGLRANIMRRLDRFERRLIAASKKQQSELMREIATARGSLYPLGKEQERAVNFISFLARYGPGLREDMLSQARAHATSLLGQPSVSRTRPTASLPGRA